MDQTNIILMEFVGNDQLCEYFQYFIVRDVRWGKLCQISVSVIFDVILI